jgi:predicted nucleic acid-binding protein
MDRLFLDANVLFSAAYRPGAGLLQLWKLRNVTLCSSRYALEEARINLADEDQWTRLADLSVSLQLFEAEPTSLPPGIRLPEKDAPILLAAMKARATHLLTGDVKHFRAHFGKKIEGIAIMRPGEYLKEQHHRARR